MFWSTNLKYIFSIALIAICATVVPLLVTNWENKDSQHQDFSALDEQQTRSLFFNACKATPVIAQKFNEKIRKVDLEKQAPLQDLVDEYHTKACTCRANATVDVAKEIFGSDEDLLQAALHRTYLTERNSLLGENNNVSVASRQFEATLSELDEADAIKEKSKDWAMKFLARSKSCVRDNKITSQDLTLRIRQIMDEK